MQPKEQQKQEEYIGSLSAGDLHEGEPTTLNLNQESICVLKIGTSIFAFSNVCSHIGGRISEGRLAKESLRVSCPIHHAVFDVRDGRSLSFPRRGLATYEVKVENGTILIGRKRGEIWRENLPSLKEGGKWCD